MNNSFCCKTVLVTGASSGVGLATARAFASAGASVALADVNEEAVTVAAERLAKQGHEAVPIFCDVSKESQVQEMVRKVVSRFGRLDAAFNSAGIPYLSLDTADLTASEFDRIIAVNLRGVWLCMKHELLQMKKQGCGSIVNNSSWAGLVGSAGRAAYSAAKHGVLGLTKSAAIEYAPLGIRINAICPGEIVPPMVRLGIASGGLAKGKTVRPMPVNRLERDDEIADAVLWLSSPASSPVIGQTIAVGRGYPIQ